MSETATGKWPSRAPTNAILNNRPSLTHHHTLSWHAVMTRYQLIMTRCHHTLSWHDMLSRQRVMTRCHDRHVVITRRWLTAESKQCQNLPVSIVLLSSKLQVQSEINTNVKALASKPKFWPRHRGLSPEQNFALSFKCLVLTGKVWRFGLGLFDFTFLVSS